MRELTKREMATITKKWDAVAKDFKEEVETVSKAIIEWIDKAYSPDDEVFDNAWAIKKLTKLYEGSKEYDYTDGVAKQVSDLQEAILSNFFEAPYCDLVAGSDEESLLNDECCDLQDDIKALIDEAIEKLS